MKEGFKQGVKELLVASLDNLSGFQRGQGEAYENE